MSTSVLRAIILTASIASPAIAQWESAHCTTPSQELSAILSDSVGQQFSESGLGNHLFPRTTIKREVGPFTIRELFPVGLSVEDVSLLVDDQEIPTDQLSVVDVTEDGLNVAEFTWVSPSVGAHRVLLLDRRTGTVIHETIIEFVYPAEAIVKAIGETAASLSPYKYGEVVKTQTGNIVIALSEDTSYAELHVADIGKIVGKPLGSNLFQFELSSEITAGRYLARIARRGHPEGKINSGKSEAIWIDYAPNSAGTGYYLDNKYALLHKTAVSEILRQRTETYLGLNFDTQVQSLPTEQLEVEVDHRKSILIQASQTAPSAPLSSNVPEPLPCPLADSITNHVFALDAIAFEKSITSFENQFVSSLNTIRAAKPVATVAFDYPARFTRMGFGPNSQSGGDTGLILLEGMVLTAQANGSWELQMPFIHPKSDVELHLQIQFKTADGQWKPLTLQPICFDGKESCSDDCLSATKCSNVKTIQGHSAILEREAGYFTEVRRRGTATFGHGYDALVENGYQY